jgi:hypothetical protein
MPCKIKKYNRTMTNLNAHATHMELVETALENGGNSSTLCLEMRLEIDAEDAYAPCDAVRESVRAGSAAGERHARQACLMPMHAAIGTRHRLQQGQRLALAAFCWLSDSLKPMCPGDERDNQAGQATTNLAASDNSGRWSFVFFAESSPVLPLSCVEPSSPSLNNILIDIF